MDKVVLFLVVLFCLVLGIALGWALRGPGQAPSTEAPPDRTTEAPSDEEPAPRLAPPPLGEAPEIHSKHFLFGYPTGTPATNDLIIRDIYALSSNDDTKFADWVAFRLDAQTVGGTADQSRRWRADPWLGANETLEPADYKGAHAALGVDRGHQAPLAAFSGTSDESESNYLSNITPQKSELNQGPWRILEDRIRRLVGSTQEVYVVTGPLYERDMPRLPGADEPHRVPSGYWKIIATRADGPDSVQVASFIFDQDTPRNAGIMDHLVSVDEVERRSRLDFLRELPDSVEEQVERDLFRAWAQQHFAR